MKTNTNLKANNTPSSANLFSSKDLASKTNKSPKNVETNASKKNFTKPSESIKAKEVNSKRPFNLQFNEYMNKQKNTNSNFLHSGKSSNNQPGSYYKAGGCKLFQII